jgi:L-histidine N-alpha-methyltransferase
MGPAIQSDYRIRVTANSQKSAFFMTVPPYFHKIRGSIRTPTLEEDAKVSLLRRPRSIPPKYFYDSTGSDLFDRICETKEYYPTRREDEILTQYGSSIIDEVRPSTILEIGSGSSNKTERLLDTCTELGHFPSYSAFDISENALLEAKKRLDQKYNWLTTSLLLGDYEAGFAHVPNIEGTTLVLFLGSTIGNLDRNSAITMLQEIRHYMSANDYLLLGYDRVKDSHILNAAYNDQQGITAAFNFNMLKVLNNRLSANFMLDRFKHSAFYDSDQQQIEMQLISKCKHNISIRSLSADFVMQKDEEIQTEISRKFTIKTMKKLLSEAEFNVVQTFSSPDNYFSLGLACPA